MKDDARIFAALCSIINKRFLDIANSAAIHRIDIIEDGSGFDELKLFRNNILVYRVIIPDDEVDSAF
jgi:hypothetical protein